ncbi:MAG TPA: hypothetical protein VG498_18110 [Terriglobales bacterium]|nr:hypothetical protein [Terriglobales bacterium]
MRRLLSTFASGAPGVGLLIMRLVGGISLIIHGLARLETGPVILGALAIAGGLLLLAGLWTPAAGSLVAILGVWKIISQRGDPWACILSATIGVALALLGPGAWSMDARLFGWRRIDVRERKS